jgi:predicted ribosome quality control (RQC) complex YloA/Tae2 family protein
LTVGPLAAVDEEETGGAPARLGVDLAPWEKTGAAATAFVSTHVRALARSALTEAQRSLARTRARLERRRLALQKDTHGMAHADAAAEHARLFVGAARKAKTGTRVLEASDWSTGEERTVAFPLRGDRPPSVEVEAVFARAKRLRGGLVIIEKRRAETEWALALIDEAADDLAALAEPLLVAGDALAEGDPSTFRGAIAARLRSLTEALPGDIRLDRGARSPGGARGNRSRSGPHARTVFRAFRASSGSPLLVGKGGADNDALTLHVARPHDLFFHVKDSVGAHVIAVRPSKGTPLDPRVHVEAALLAAHFSSERAEAVVDVQWCERRHLRKRKGAPEGLVELTQERVLAVRHDPDLLAELLATENRDD